MTIELLGQKKEKKDTFPLFFLSICLFLVFQIWEEIRYKLFWAPLFKDQEPTKKFTSTNLNAQIDYFQKEDLRKKSELLENMLNYSIRIQALDDELAKRTI